MDTRIRFDCPKCHKHLKAKQENKRRLVKCPRCTQWLYVPATSQPSDDIPSSFPKESLIRTPSQGDGCSVLCGAFATFIGLSLTVAEWVLNTGADQISGVIVGTGIMLGGMAFWLGTLIYGTKLDTLAKMERAADNRHSDP